jgi:hypothetical protein
MVMHDVVVSGVNLAGALQSRPALLQVNDDDFPKVFLQELSAIPQPPASAMYALLPGELPPPVIAPAPMLPLAMRRILHLPTTPAIPVTLFQPVQRVMHLALVQLNCDTIGSPRLDPKRILSAGLVIRRVPLCDGLSNLQGLASPWLKDSTGQFSWQLAEAAHADDDPDPTQRPVPQSGQPALDQMLAAQALATASTETYTPAFVAAPNVCNAAQRTLAYAVIPTASSEASSQLPPPPQYDDKTLAKALPTLLKHGEHAAPQAGNVVSYQWMSDDFVRAKSGATDFLIFSTTLRMLHTVFGAFEPTPEAANLLAILNQHNVTMPASCPTPTVQMGAFYQHAAKQLIDYDPSPTSTAAVPTLTMPVAWDVLTHKDQHQIVEALKALLNQRSAKALTPQGRFQDASRLYRLRMFFRIKNENPNCPPQLVWSCFSDPFRIAAWYEGSGRPVAPVPLPDPTDPGFLASTKPDPLKPASYASSFAVPSGLMNSMQGTTLSGLLNLPPGSGPSGGSAGGGINLNWICGFNIPLITICAFFVLNIFLSLLNIVFFWLPFIKICIPFPFSPPPGTTSGQEP